MAEKLDWSKQDLDPDTLALRRIPAGTQVRDHWWNLRAHSNSVAVVAARRSSMLAEATGDLQEVLSQAHDAVVRVINGEVSVGVREKQLIGDGNKKEVPKHLFGADYGEDERWATLAPELGRVPVMMGMGLWLPEEKLWYGAQDIAVVESTLSIDAVGAHDRYPHTSVVSLS